MDLEINHPGTRFLKQYKTRELIITINLLKDVITYCSINIINETNGDKCMANQFSPGFGGFCESPTSLIAVDNSFSGSFGLETSS